MATATATDRTVFEQIEELRQEAEGFETEARDKMGEAQAAMEKRNDALKRMGELAATASEETVQFEGNATPSTTTVNAPKKKGVTGAAPKPIPKHASAPAKKTVPGKKLAKVAPGQRNYDNEMSLPQAIWDVLDRKSNTYKKYIPDYPDGADGLKVSEIKDVIEAEKKWVSSSENISPQIQQVVGKLREDGKLARSEDRRYFIVKGATLDGPELDAHGKPIK
jgi:hypothetical protein